ncbi:MAG: hypothetical protein N4A37_03500 [Prolixibacteraceae bacterium]|jgi:hypothetical protein|nr:hypothetical protein [Prolixibacteraceae bacterium]
MHLLYYSNPQHQRNAIKVENLKVLPAWFVHGCSMVPPSKTPKSMDKPWTNHGRTMDEPWRNHGQTLYLTYGNLH